MPKVILTKHALERAKSRKMELRYIEQAIGSPDEKIDLGENKFKFLKNIAGRRYQLIATFIPKENSWLVISTWVRGEEDQLPLVWRLLSAPFMLLWWLVKKTFSLLWKIIAKIASKK